MKNKLILSFYIDIRDIDENEVAEYLNQVKMAMSSQIESQGDDGVMAFFIPIKGESKVECINPVLVVEEEAINNFNAAMEELQKLNFTLKETIINKNEKAEK